MTRPSRGNLSGKIYDPVFLCMVGAMVLAIASSIALRTVVSHAGPAAAQGAEGHDDPAASDEPILAHHAPFTHSTSEAHAK